MPQESFAESPARGGGKFLSTHAQLIEWLLARTAAARWGVTRARFATALERSAVHHFRGRVREAEPTDADVAAYLASLQDRKSTRLNSSHLGISYAVFCLKKK